MTRIKNEIEIKLCNCTMFKLSKGMYVFGKCFKDCIHTLFAEIYTTTFSEIRIQYSSEGFSNFILELRF